MGKTPGDQIAPVTATVCRSPTLPRRTRRRQCNQQQREGDDLRDAAYRGLQRLEHTFLHRQSIEGDDVDTIQPNREAGMAPNIVGTKRHIGGIGEDDNCYEIGDNQRDERRRCALHLVGRDRYESVTTGSAAAHVDKNLLFRGS